VRILLLGGSGFIGRNLLQRWRNQEILAPSSRDLNLLDFCAVQSFVRDSSPDVIVHSACRPGHRNAAPNPHVVRDNIRLVLNVVASLGPLSRLVWISTGGAYGSDNYRPMMREREAFDVPPADDTGLSRFAVSLAVRNDPRIVELRPFSVYGPHEDWEIRFISNAICKSLYKMSITIRRDRLFSFVHVEDLMIAIEEVIKKWPSKDLLLNVCPDRPSRLSDVARIVQAATRCDLPVMIKNEGFDIEYSGSNRLLRNLYPGWRCRSLEDGVRGLALWYMEHIDLINRELLLQDK
jgi:UDP-glucose 4-epimerase